MRGNETDVREEIATPFLSELGYERGTANDILREFSLSYDRMFLGRKKKTDVLLRGRADYILSVVGAARWVLEIKAPNETLSKDVVDQALSYARHPEISAAYAALLNGKRFVVFHSSQNSNDVPIADLEVVSPSQLASQMEGLLSPAAVRRDCGPPKVDLNAPLVVGFRSSTAILRGFISYSEFTWECNFQLPAQQKNSLDEMCRKMKGFRSTVIGGKVWRDELSRIRAKLDWTLPHDEMLKFVHDKKLLDIEYFSLSSSISTDPDRPTVFDVVGNVRVEKGEVLFDILRWDSKAAGIDMTMNYRGQAAGIIEGAIFKGNFQAEYESRFPAVPGAVVAMFGVGKFEVVLDNR